MTGWRILQALSLAAFAAGSAWAVREIYLIGA